MGLQLHTWTRAWNRNPRYFEALRRLQAEGWIRHIGLSTPEHDQNSVVSLMPGGRAPTRSPTRAILVRESGGLERCLPESVSSSPEDTQATNGT